MFFRLLVALPFCGVISSVPKPFRRSRFRFHGPILTITIPSDLSSLSSEFGRSSNEEESINSYSDSSLDSMKMKRSINKILKRRMKSVELFAHSICETLRPICVYSIASRQPPLPYWCPALKACSARIGYAHHMEADERTVLTASRFVDHSSSLSSDAAVTQKASLMQPLHPSSNGFIEGISKFEFNLMNRNDVLQLAIKPCWEWVTSRTRGIPHRISEHEQPQSTIRVSSSSVLFHARRHSSSYAWCRFMSSSSAPLIDSRNLNDDNRFDVSDSENGTKTQETIYDRWFETTMRMSTLISLPLAYVASIRVTPTFRCIQMLTPSQQRMRKGRCLEKRTTQIDASCQLEATSGGQGRTTATLTVSPMDSAQFMKLAMEYRLSGFGTFPLFRRGRGTEKKAQAQSPQHWIRQIWEWNRPCFPPRSSVREKESFMMKRYRSAKTTILASQYQWLMVWPSGQSIRTIFDPPRDDFQHGDGKMNGAVSFTWIDPTKESIHEASSLSGGGVGGWITELRIPFLDASRNDDSHIQDGLLVRNLGAAEVRVRRQFCF